MTKPYSPQPGTVAAQAIKYLATLPLGTEIANAVLAEAIGHTSTAVGASLKPAADRGVIGRRRAEESGLIFWRLIEMPAAELVSAEQATTVAADDFEHPPVQVVLKPGQWPPVKAPAAVKQDLTPEPEKPAEREKHVATRAWFSSDGQLVVEAGEHELVFGRLEARQLVRTIRELWETWA